MRTLLFTCLVGITLALTGCTRVTTPPGQVAQPAQPAQPNIIVMPPAQQPPCEPKKNINIDIDIGRYPWWPYYPHPYPPPPGHYYWHHHHHR